MTEFEDMMEAVKSICHDRQACKEGYRRLLTAENPTQLVEVFCRYWSDIQGDKFKKEALDFLNAYYPKYRDTFRQSGLTYNEDADHGRVWLHDCNNAVISGDATAFLTGNCSVKATQRAELIMEQCDGSSAEVHDNARVTMRCDATVYVYGNAHANVSAGKAFCWGQSELIVGGYAKLMADSWHSIQACGNAVVTAPHANRIRVFGDAVLVIEKK